MTGEQDLTSDLQAQIEQAFNHRTPLKITGGGSKTFFGSPPAATETLIVTGHRGIIYYEPSELVVTVRAGTALQTLVKVLDGQGQMLAFEPPYFNAQATVGGTVACGLSGPRRPYAGSVSDFVLGCAIINGQAEILKFGGQVMKNVAGFDVSRLMVGALGQLGLLLDVSIRVMSRPEAEVTLRRPLSSANQAVEIMQRWQGQSWPISGLVYDGELLRARLSGAETAIKIAAQQLGGDLDEYGQSFWDELRDHRLDFFNKSGDLWRINIAPATPMLQVSGEWLLDWGGAQRWLKSPESAGRIHQIAEMHNGSAVCFRGAEKHDWIRFESERLALQKRVRRAFDPYRLFNPDCFLPGL